MEEHRMASCAIPIIDPAVKFLGVSKLRDFNATKLRDSSDSTYVFQENDQPLAVLLSYDRYLVIQQQLQQGRVNTVDLLTNEEEFKGVREGLDDIMRGRIKPLSQVKDALNRK
jgi:hypothetical protein